MATYTASDLGRGLLYNGQPYQRESCVGTLTYDSYYESDNTMVVQLQRLDLSYSASNISGAVKGRNCIACCGPWSVQFGADFGGATVLNWTLGIDLPLGNYSWSRTSTATYRIQPGSSVTIPLYYHHGSGTCGDAVARVSFTNNRTRPTPTPPSLTLSCGPSSVSATAGTFSASGSYGYCESQSNYTRWYLYRNSDLTGLVTSGSGTSATFSGLNPNTRYYVNVIRSNGCFVVERTCNFVTLTPNTLTDPKATSWQSGCVRVTVNNGGKVYPPNTCIWYRKKGSSAWTKGPCTDTTTVDELCISGLEEDTCYEVQGRTTTTAGTYTGNTVSFCTPKKCVQGVVTSTDIGLDQKTWESYAKVCVHYEAYTSPCELSVQYRVKGGYDQNWQESDVLHITDPITTVGGKIEGDYCFTLHNLFPNLTEYEMRLHGTADDCDLTTDPTTFITPLVPEPDPVKVCETLHYLTELICQAVKELEKGNKTIYANPYSAALCDPYNENPTHLTLWSRFLRFAHAVNCLTCNMADVGLKAGLENQYYVGEVGWVDMLEEILEDTDKESWRLVTSGVIRAYIDSKLHEVWHYHGAVDYIVNKLGDAPSDAKKVLNLEDSKVYVKQGGNWVLADEKEQPDDFAVYHINKALKSALGDVKAESAWYYFQGTWNNLDANTATLAKKVKYLYEHKDDIAYNEPGKARISIQTNEQNFDYNTLPCGERKVCFVLEDMELPPQGYHRIKFITGSDATIIQDQDVLDGALAQRPTDPTKYCMDFTDWEDETVPGVSFNWNTVIKRDYTLKAIWSPHPVTITFDLGSDKATGTVPSPINGFCGNAIGTLPTSAGFSRPGGTFSGWAIDGVPIDATYTLTDEDKTAVALWTMEKYNVTFHLDNGDPNVVKVVEYEETAEPPADPERTDFIFTGWYLDSDYQTPWDETSPVYNDTDIYAGWIPAYYTVSFNSDGGSPVPSQTVAYQDYADRPADPTKDGFILKEWQLNGEPYNFDVPVTEDITLVAVWDTVYTVTFDPNGGSPKPDDQKIPAGDFISMPPVPSKTGAEFAYWEYNGAEYQFGTDPVQSNMTLKARWYYTVEFDADGGSPVPPTQKVLDGGQATKPTDPTKDGYEFECWEEE